jgi:hypothetical protein
MKSGSVPVAGVDAGELAVVEQEGADTPSYLLLEGGVSDKLILEDDSGFLLLEG